MINQIAFYSKKTLMQSWTGHQSGNFPLVPINAMTVGTQGSIMGKYTIDTEGNKTVLTLVKEEKDLGVKFDECLNFATHISEVITKGNQRIGLIRRSFTFMNKQIFLTLYKALVRPLLEYCNTIWHPLYKKENEGLEKVQRRATKLVK